MRHVTGPGRISPRVAVCLALMLGSLVFPASSHAATTVSIITTVAGNGTSGFFGDGSPATAASLNLPSAIAIDAAGNVFFSDTVNNRIRRIDVTTGTITTFAGGGPIGVLGDSGAATSATLSGPIGIAFDGAGNLFIADVGNNRIRKVTAGTGKISTVAGGGNNIGLGDNGPALNAILTNPQGVAVDAVGNFYIADTGNALVREVDAASGFIRAIAGTGTPATSNDGGLASLSSLIAPVSVILDSKGNILISDTGDNRIRKIDGVTGFISTVAGGGSSLADGGPATAALLITPKQIALDSGGNLFIADEGNNRIRRVDSASGFIATIAGTGSPGFSGDGGLAVNATLTDPRGLGIDAAGSLYLADTNNVRIRRVIGSATPAGGLPAPNGTIIVGSAAIGKIGGAGPLPIPCFLETQGEGGTGPVIVTFDPHCTYLPVSPDPTRQVYLYQAIWDFGDGTTQIIPSGSGVSDPLQALANVAHTYTGDSRFTVKLTIQIVLFNLVDKSVNAGPTAFVTGQVHVTPANFPPTPILKVVSSPATGVLPYTLVVDPSDSFDEDGFIVWAALDWGDGSCQIIDLAAHPLPFIPQLAYTHTYTQPGVFKVALSVIDNGRAGTGVAYPQPPCDNPQAALESLAGFSSSNFPSLNPLRGPSLNQDFAVVQVPGSLVVERGGFKVDFKQKNRDSFDVSFRWNTAIETVANVKVTLQLGSKIFPEPLPGQPASSFQTDQAGRYSNGAQGLQFDFNPKKKTVHLKLSHADLAAALRVSNGNVVNGNVDVPVFFIINGVTPVGATVRVVYNSKLGDKGTGTGARSQPNGN